MIEVFRIPFSTNVERVALAAGHKGLTIDWIGVDPDDRAPVREVSGQELVPVLVDGGRVVCDSPVILDYLEELHPDPPLYPAGEARRAEAGVFCDWFNRVWKRPPNELVDLEPGDERARALAAELSSSRDLFEALLAGRDYLFGEFSIADCTAFPFLKYALLWDEDDDEPFHRILVEHLRLDGGYPRLEAWIRRVDGHPRA